jgi:2-phosphosulfolactate phosphatase
MQRHVVIDSFPESASDYGRDWAIVAVDVIRATTSAVTIAAKGGRCFPVASLDAARDLAATLEEPLLAGEVNGEIAPGFEINNSPAELSRRDLCDRPVVLLSSSGTRLIYEARRAGCVYLASFRNFRHTARTLAGRCPRIAVIGAGTRGEFREEDQMCCAWIADLLIADGYSRDKQTEEIVERWKDMPPKQARYGRSADYLRRSNQLQDLEFILSHINDLAASFIMCGPEVALASGAGLHVTQAPHAASAPADKAVTSW